MDSQINDSEIPWVFIESYFKNKHLKQLVKHQLESFRIGHHYTEIVVA